MQVSKGGGEEIYLIISEDFTPRFIYLIQWYNLLHWYNLVLFSNEGGHIP